MARAALELKLPDWAKAKSGYGDGDGSGYGDGDGSGYGYGDGDGDGSGYGYGDGDGSGYGDGYGYGDGSGYGDEKNRLLYFAALLAPYDRSQDRRVMFWRSREDGFPANSGKPKTQARVGLTEEVPGPLRLCSANALHGTLNPGKWEGSRWWVVALHKPVISDTDKSGSLKRTILADLGKCPF